MPARPLEQGQAGTDPACPLLFYGGQKMLVMFRSEGRLFRRVTAGGRPLKHYKRFHFCGQYPPWDWGADNEGARELGRALLFLFSAEWSAKKLGDQFTSRVLAAIHRPNWDMESDLVAEWGWAAWLLRWGPREPSNLKSNFEVWMTRVETDIIEGANASI